MHNRLKAYKLLAIIIMAQNNQLIWKSGWFKNGLNKYLKKNTQQHDWLEDSQFCYLLIYLHQMLPFLLHQQSNKNEHLKSCTCTQLLDNILTVYFHPGSSLFSRVFRPCCSAKLNPSASTVALSQGGQLLIQVSCKTSEGGIYPYGKPKNSFLSLQEVWKGAGYISRICPPWSVLQLLNKAVSCSKVTSWGIPTLDDFHKPVSQTQKYLDEWHKVWNLSTSLLSNENTISFCHRFGYSQLLRDPRSRGERDVNELIFKIEEWDFLSYDVWIFIFASKPF